MSKQTAEQAHIKLMEAVLTLDKELSELQDRVPEQEDLIKMRIRKMSNKVRSMYIFSNEERQ